MIHTVDLLKVCATKDRLDRTHVTYKPLSTNPQPIAPTTEHRSQTLLLGYR